MTPVTFFLFEGPSQTPLENVVIRVYSQDGSTFITEVETDVAGEVVFDLPDLTTYWVRFFKPGYRFPMKAMIQVNSTAPNNAFDVQGTNLVEAATSPYSGLCRVSGVIVDPSGTPVPGASLRFMTTPAGNPRVYHDRAIIPYDVKARSIEEGYIELDLIQGGLYEVTFEGVVGADYGGFTKELRVPNTTGVGLSDLIWPYIVSAEFASPTLSLAAGQSTTIGFDVVLSSQALLPLVYIDSTIDVPNLVLIHNDGGGSSLSGWNGVTRTYTVNAGASGSTTVFTVALREDLVVDRVPAPTPILGTLTVTVT